MAEAGGAHLLMSCPLTGDARPSCCMRLKSSRRARTRRSCSLPSAVRTDSAPKVRFSATLGEEPEVELGLV